MSKENLSVLLGIHGDSTQYEGFCKDVGFYFDTSRTPKAMLEKVANREYDRYLMDLNLGAPNSPDITPAIQVYDKVRSRVESGRAKFMGISGNKDAVKAAKERGIPAEYILNFSFGRFLGVRVIE